MTPLHFGQVVGKLATRLRQQIPRDGRYLAHLLRYASTAMRSGYDERRK